MLTEHSDALNWMLRWLKCFFACIEFGNATPDHKQMPNATEGVGQEMSTSC